MNDGLHSIQIDETVHTYPSLNEAALAYIAARERGCSGVNVSALKEVKARAMEIAYGSSQ